MAKKINIDIWNGILQHRSIEYWTFRKFPETNLSVKDKKKFLECISNYDLTTLYEMDRKIHHTILALANYIFFSNQAFDEEYAEEILSTIYSSCPEITECLDEPQLISEIKKTIETPNKYYKNEVFKTPSHLMKLACFYTLVHQKIRNVEVSSWRVKPEAYLKSFSTFCPQYGDEEALLYLWSRDIDEYPLTLNHVRDRWKYDITGDMILDQENSFPGFFPSILACKLIDWCVIDIQVPLGEVISGLIDCLTTEDGIIHSPTTLFEMFTSQKCISISQQLLKKGLQAYEKCLRKPLENEDASFFEESSIGIEQLTNIIATYVFGHYRMPSVALDEKVVELGVNYLLDRQKADGSFWHIEDKLDYAIYQTAICTHALALSELERERCQKSASSAALWLKKKQNDYGIWQSNGDDNPVPLTVLVMDSIDFAEGKPTTIADMEKTSEKLTKNTQETLYNQARIKLSEMGASDLATAKQLASAYDMTLTSVKTKLSKVVKANPIHRDDYVQDIDGASGPQTRLLFKVKVVLPILDEMKDKQLKKATKKKR